jgi:hypothetical protein
MDAARAKSAAIYRDWAAALDPEGLPAHLADPCLTLCAAFVGADGRGGLARAAERAETAADLDTVRQVAAELIEQAAQLQDEVNDARERAGRLADDDDEPDDYPEPDDDDGQDDDGPEDELWTAARELPGRTIVVRGGQVAPLALPPGLSGTARATAEMMERRGQWAGNTGARADMGPCRICGAPWRGCLHQRPAAPPRAPQYTLGAALGGIGAQLARDRARIEQYGHCARGRHGLFGSTPAPTLRVVGNNTGHPGAVSYGAPEVYICGSAKCLDWADAKFKAVGWANCTYSELP